MTTRDARETAKHRRAANKTELEKKMRGRIIPAQI